MKVGTKCRIKYDNWISKGVYEVVAEGVIGFNYVVDKNIKGWPDGSYGNKYKLFWYVSNDNLVNIYGLEIE